MGLLGTHLAIFPTEPCVLRTFGHDGK
eukprot:COSAG02_NODE_46385_length_349_cov_0.820000_1_plen_26_part_01